MSSLLKDLFERGAHYGFSRRRRHPSVNPYLYGFKNRSAVIDLEKSLVLMARAEAALKVMGEKRQTVIFVGSKPEARLAVAATAERLGLPYVTSRWIGGTLTNFPEIKRRLARLEELKKQLSTGGLEMYTKQERGRFQKELDRLERTFGTIADLKSLPTAIVVVDSEAEGIAVAEASTLNLPIVSLSGTDCDLRPMTYPVVGNDASTQTIEWFLSRLAMAYEAGIAVAASTPAATPTV